MIKDNFEELRYKMILLRECWIESGKVENLMERDQQNHIPTEFLNIPFYNISIPIVFSS